MRRGRGSLRRYARDVPSGRRRRTRDGHLYVGTANVWRQRRAKRVRCTPGLGRDATKKALEGHHEKGYSGGSDGEGALTRGEVLVGCVATMPNG